MKAWEPEEDHIILQMVNLEGPKWKSIVKKLPGRTVSSVRNRWQRIEKGRKLREDGADLKNRCHACGLPKRGHICLAKMSGGPQVRLPALEKSCHPLFCQRATTLCSHRSNPFFSAGRWTFRRRRHRARLPSAARCR